MYRALNLVKQTILAMQKRVFGHMRTAKVQISLRIRAVWSDTSLFANGITGFFKRVWMESKGQGIVVQS